MKFICLSCDRPLRRSTGEASSEHGSVDLVLECRACDARLGFLAEERETWMLESVEDAGPAAPVDSDEDRELPRPAIARPVGETEPGSADEWSPAQTGAAFEEEDARRARAGAELLARAHAAGSAALGMAAEPLRWTPEAERKLLDLSASVAQLERERVESLARDRGEDQVTASTVERAATTDDRQAD